jgi:hypothetical protein
MTTEKRSSGRDLVRTIASNQLGDATFDLAEVALDQNLTEGILKEVPIVGTLVKILRARQSISDELFVRKLVRFLADLKTVPPADRENLLKCYPNSSEQQRVLGENLLLAIERLDDVEKPAVLARFFSAFIQSRIDYTTFTRLAHALEKFNLALLPNLRWFYTRHEPIIDTPEEITHELSLAGLVTAQLTGSGTLGGSASYQRSSLGQIFLSIGFGVIF